MAKKYKNVNEFMEEYFRENSSRSIDELTDFVELYADKPEIKKLIRQYYRNITNRLVRKIKNEDGKRRVYADKKTDVYVDIEHENDITRLTRIRRNLRYQSVGNQTAYKIVTKRLAELNGQTILEFEIENPLLAGNE